MQVKGVRRLLDGRCTAYQKRFKALFLTVVVGFALGILFFSFLSASSGPLLNPRGRSPEPPTPTVTPTETSATWNDAIRSLLPSKWAGQLIRICIDENKRQNKYATNWNGNGTYDYSWCQINSIHKPKGMTDDQWKKNLRDPDYHAEIATQIYINSGPWAWTNYRFGHVR